MTTAATAGTSTSLRTLLREGAGRDDIAAFLDGLSGSARVEQALAISGKEVGRLYDACAGGPRLTLEDCVPASVSDGQEVIFEGRNSLPLFTRFQKRFARMGGEIVGYNHQPTSFVTGPGYFVVRPPSDDADVPGELYFDYTGVPKAHPSEWPSFKPNDSGLANLVYKNMKDYMRHVARGVMVGAAYKLGKRQDAYFVLARP